MNDANMTYFPFIGSDHVESRRCKMNDQLKSDLKSFLNYQKVVKQRQKSHLAYTHDKISNIYSEDNVPEAYLKSQNRTVKHLYDSSYVKPQENFRVVQDTNPVKAAILVQAEERHSNELKNNSQIHSKNLTEHQSKVQFDSEQFQREREAKKAKQRDFFTNIENQVKENVSIFG